MADSSHLIPSLILLKTKAQAKFVTFKQNCKIEENITYECPLAFIPLCKAELNSQRTTILSNLKKQQFEDVWITDNIWNPVVVFSK